MWILIVILIGVALFGLVAGYFYNRNIQKKIDRGELEEAPPVVTVDSECCGQHQICEKESLLAAVSKQIEYYDDEELDRFKGRPSDGYSEEEIEEFRDIRTPCRKWMWQDGAGVCNFAALNCPTN